MSCLWLMLLTIPRAPAQAPLDPPTIAPELTETQEEEDSSPIPEDAAPLPVDDGPQAPAVLPPIPTELERAKEAYFDGGHEEAITILGTLRDRIDDGAIASEQVRVEIGIYLGEVLLLLQDQESAWRAFRWLLLQYPTCKIQPALHPPEVVTWFEAARAEVQAELASNAEPPPVVAPAPLPPWGYAPLGIPQFGQGQPVRGSLYATGQAAAAGLSVGVFVHLVKVNQRNHPDSLTDEQVGPYVRRWRNGVQWPATAVFYSLWVASSLDARASWARSGARLDVLPSKDGAELRISGRF